MVRCLALDCPERNNEVVHISLSLSLFNHNQDFRFNIRVLKSIGPPRESRRGNTVRKYR